MNSELSIIKKTLKSRYAQYGKDRLFNDAESRSAHGKKLRTYRKFKNAHKLEPYLSKISNPQVRRELTKFRISAHKLMIEVGRHGNINLDERICTVCPMQEIEDELHSLLRCSHYATERLSLNEKLKTIYDWFTEGFETVDLKEAKALLNELQV